MTSSNGGVAGGPALPGGPGGPVGPVMVTSSTSSVSAVSTASPLPAPAPPGPARPVSSISTPTKSSGPAQYSLSQSPNNSSPSSGGVTALMAGLTNHLQTENQRQNFAQAAAPTQNGEFDWPDWPPSNSFSCRPSQWRDCDGGRGGGILLLPSPLSLSLHLHLPVL